MSSLIGKRFGRYLVLHNLKRGKYWCCFCVCDCGTFKVVRKSSLLDGDSKSCGCLSLENLKKPKTHGLHSHPLYNHHHDMIRGVTIKVGKDYKHYGKRGIDVCDRWRGKDGLFNFIEDMLGSYITGLEIDRVDNNKGYSLENCRWATRRQQVINRRHFEGSIFNTHYVTFNGKTLCLSQWEDETGIPRSVLSDRLFA